MAIKLLGSNTGSLTLDVPASVTGNIDFKFPANTGSGNQLLMTDGSGNLSFQTVQGVVKNFVDNGEMMINQRGETSYTLSNPGVGGVMIDRWRAYYNSAVDYTFTQDTDAPDGFKYSQKIEMTAANYTPPSYQYGTLYQGIEGQQALELGWHTSSPKNATLSFYVKASIAGTWVVTLTDSGGGGSTRYVAEYTINAADTWERKVINIPAPTIGTFRDDNFYTIAIHFDLGAGTMWHSPSPNQWAGNQSSHQSTSNAVNMSENLNSTFKVTGVQLEVGDSASPYVHQTPHDYLIRCQRYYKRLFVQPDSSSSQVLTGDEGSSLQWKFFDLRADLMRANPSISLVNNTDIEVSNGNGTWGSSGGFSSNTQGTYPNVQAYVYKSGNSSTGVCKRVRKTTSGHVLMEVSAEL